MPTTIDLRLIQGTAVQTRAILLTHASKCRRIFGSQFKTATIDGSVVSTRKAKRKKVSQTVVLCQRNFPNEPIQKEINLRSIKLKPICTTDSEHLINNPPDTIDQITPNNPAPVFPPGTNLPHSGAQHLLPINSHTNETTNGRNWIQENCIAPINGPLPRRQWKVYNNMGQTWHLSQRVQSPNILNIFFTLFAMKHINRVTSLTNENFIAQKLRRTTCGEIYKLLGMLILIARLQFNN